VTRESSSALTVGVALAIGAVVLASVPKTPTTPIATLHGYGAWRDRNDAAGYRVVRVAFEQMKSSVCSLVVIDSTDSGRPKVQHLLGRTDPEVGANLQVAELHLRFGPQSFRGTQRFSFIVLNQLGIPSLAFDVNGQELHKADTLWINSFGSDIKFHPAIEYTTRLTEVAR
jgi:hypothetical protein